MARRPTQIGHAGAPLRLVPMAVTDPPDGAEEDRTTVEQPPSEDEETNNGALTTPAREPPKSAEPASRVDERWEDGTTVEEATVNANPPGTDGFGVAQEELTVDEPPKPAVLARLVVIAGNDTGREFVLAPGKPLTIGRAVDNDIVLTDIAVSRKHLDLVWEGAWVLKDRGSGNGTLLNDRLEDGQCKLQHGDRIEIGHTVFRFDHVGSAGVGPELGWGTQNDDEASTVAGRAPQRAQSQPKGPPPPTQPPTNRRAKTGSVPPPLPTDRGKAALPPPRPNTPSQGALSARLVLPPNPTAPEPPIVAEPSFLVAAGLTTGSPATPSDSLSASMRSMTATAHVEPLSYSSGTLAPVPIYAHLGPRSMRRPLAIGAGIAAAVALIGVIAMLTTGSPPPTDPEGLAAVEGGTTVTAVADDDAAATGSGDTKGSTDLPPADDPPADDPPADDPPTDDPPAPVVKDPPPVVKDPPPVVKNPPPVVKDPPPVVKNPVVKPPVDKPKVKNDKPKVVKNDKPKVKNDKPAGGAAAAKKKAASLYAAKDFKGAAAAARDGAASASEDEASELSKLASTYDALASSMATGNASAASKPTEALTAFKKALSADKKLGGTHASMIREKLAAVAPKAAAGFMAKGNYEAAKSAADTAVNFGAGSSSTVTQVRESLERKAGELYASGKKLADSKPDEAKALFRRVLKIVPPDSGWYTKAYKALNTRPQTKDDDE